MDITLTGRSADAAGAERHRALEIARLSSAHNVQQLGDEHITKGTTLADFRGLLLEHLRVTGSTKPLEAPAAAIGLTESQARSFSLSKLIASELDPMKRDVAGFERAVVGTTRDEVQGRGYEPKGLVLPYEVVRAQLAPWMDPEYAQRTMLAGSGTGTNLVQTTVMGGQYIPPNYIQPRVVEAGATVLTGLVGNTKLPKMSAGSNAAWVSTENTAPAQTDPTFAQVSLSPKDVGCYVDVSRRLILQSTPGIDTLISTDLARQIAIAVDAAALNGTGASGQPQGIAGTAGVNLNPIGTNGGPLTWAVVTTNVQLVAAANLLGGKLGWITSAQGRLHCARTVKVASYPEYLADAPGFNTMVGYPIYTSQNVSTTVTKGTLTNGTQLFFGAWDMLVIGYWSSGLDLLLDPYTFSSSGGVRIRALSTVDIAPRYAAAFSATLDVNPT